MNNTEFKGPFKDIFTLYIKFKQSQGFDYKSGIGELKRFDAFLVKNNVIKCEITKEIVEKYCSRKNANESNKTIYNRQVFIKNLTHYLNKSGYKNVYYYNHDFVKFSDDFEPYIFSRKDINRLFEYLTEKNVNNLFNCKDERLGNNLKVIIELAYCCGLRKSEIINLRYEDVDIDNKIITIKDSKNHVTRILPISDSVLKELEKTKKIYQPREYFFMTSYNKKYDKHITDKFQKILSILNIKNNQGHVPRLHDLRFTFAVRALEKMEDAGIDLYCFLPILSVYMGHKNIKSTEYYLKFTESARNRINKKMIETSNYIFDKGVNYNE